MFNRSLAQQGPLQSVWQTLVNQELDVATGLDGDSGGRQQGALTPKPAVASNLYQARVASAQLFEAQRLQQRGGYHLAAMPSITWRPCDHQSPGDRYDELRIPAHASRKSHTQKEGCLPKEGQVCPGGASLMDSHDREHWSHIPLPGMDGETQPHWKKVGSEGAALIREEEDQGGGDLSEVLPATPDEPDTAGGDGWQPGMIG